MAKRNGGYHLERHFADRLLLACAHKETKLVVGLDPHFDLLPPHLVKQAQTAAGVDNPRMAAAAAILLFNKEIIEAVADQVAAVKPQLAFYEQWGPPGIQAYEETVKMAHQYELLVIADAKRNDIGSTAQAYAEAYLGTDDDAVRPHEADAITINPYLGWDGIAPFLERSSMGKGAFALVRTSNPSAGDVQNAQNAAGEPLFVHVADLINEWGNSYRGNSGYSALGAVVGATYPQDIALLRKRMPNSLFLVPGFGAQGASATDVAAAFNADGQGAVVNTSRQVLFAYRQVNDPTNYAKHARNAAKQARLSLNAALER